MHNKSACTGCPNKYRIERRLEYRLQFPIIKKLHKITSKKRLKVSIVFQNEVYILCNFKSDSFVEF